MAQLQRTIAIYQYQSCHLSTLALLVCPLSWTLQGRRMLKDAGLSGSCVEVLKERSPPRSIRSVSRSQSESLAPDRFSSLKHSKNQLSSLKAFIKKEGNQSTLNGISVLPYQTTIVLLKHDTNLHKHLTFSKYLI